MAARVANFLDLSGKAAIVTGGSSGIGKAICRLLAQAGAHVTLTVDSNVDGAKEVCGEIEASGCKARFIRADVRNPDDSLKVCQKVVDELGHLDILVNNAGVYPAVPVLNIDEGVWDKVMNVNLRGAFFFSKAAAQQMIKAGNGGRIINIVSLEALHPVAMHAHYSASKGGLVMLTKSMALELAASKITVNAVAPGVVMTPGLEQQLQVFSGAAGMTIDQLLQATTYPRIPTGRLGTPDDIAKATLFLASSLADYITGDVVVVDGGYLLT